MSAADDEVPFGSGPLTKADDERFGDPLDRLDPGIISGALVIAWVGTCELATDGAFVVISPSTIREDDGFVCRLPFAVYQDEPFQCSNQPTWSGSVTWDGGLRVEGDVTLNNPEDLTAQTRFLLAVYQIAAPFFQRTDYDVPALVGLVLLHPKEPS